MAQPTARPPHGYRFAGEWRLPADPDAVFHVLADTDGYPQWWPNVQRADDTAEQHFRRALVTGDVTVSLSRSVMDAERRILVLRLTGQICGTERWEVLSVRGGARARHYEHFAVAGEAGAHGGILLRLVVHAIHDRVMRQGERALADYLERAS